MQRIVAKFIRIECGCGVHIVDLFGAAWNDRKVGIYECNTCNRPLVCRGDDGEFYYVGGRIE